MKKLLAVILAAMLMLAAAAEGMDMQSYKLVMGESASLDLDGDGTLESVRWETELYDMSDEAVRVTVTRADGNAAAWVSGMLNGAQVYACDIDADGQVELFVTGDEMSDDYLTYALRYSDGALTPLPFENGDRGDETPGFHEAGYGLVDGIGENALTLLGSQDVLGTYFGTRTYALKDGRFVFDDDGLWHFQYDYDDDWEWKALTLKQPLGAAINSGSGMEQATLEAGTQLRVTASDRSTIAYFVTKDGREGVLPIAPSADDGYGFVVEGVNEDELFKMVPYSD